MSVGPSAPSIFPSGVGEHWFHTIFGERDTLIRFSLTYFVTRYIVNKVTIANQITKHHQPSFSFDFEPNIFHGASSFYRDLSSWNTGNVTNMSYMSYGASSFNGFLTWWNTGSVISMCEMFHGTSSFNGDLSEWVTSAVTDTSGMFRDASKFNSELGGW